MTIERTITIIKLPFGKESPIYASLIFESMNSQRTIGLTKKEYNQLKKLMED